MINVPEIGIHRSVLQSRAVAEGQGDFDILVKFSEYRNHPVKGEAFELGVPNAGKFGMGNAGQFFGFAGPYSD
jgi:hypothetical protein